MHEEILITAGVGDFLTLDSFFNDHFRSQIKRIYYATKFYRLIIEIIRSLPNYSSEIEHIPVFKDCDRCYLRKGQVMKLLYSTDMLLAKKVAKAKDCGIMQLFPRCHKYEGSSVLRYRLADIERFELPSFYTVVFPYSVNASPGREFNDEDWEYIPKTEIVVLGTGEFECPPRAIDLRNKTTICECIEILKASRGYIGVDSFLSVVAAKLFPANKLMVKTLGALCIKARRIYFAPLEDFGFLGYSLKEISSRNWPSIASTCKLL